MKVTTSGNIDPTLWNTDDGDSIQFASPEDAKKAAALFSAMQQESYYEGYRKAIGDMSKIRCPRPMNDQPDDLTVEACIKAGTCWCCYGS